jgi:pyruvate dehydrogenase E1 component alpha subunit
MYKDKVFSLGNLADPDFFHDPIDLNGLGIDVSIQMLTSMSRIRATEIRLAEGRRDGLISGPVHLGVGQEAIAVGVSNNLKSTDKIFGAHRSHAHLVALGSSIYKLFSEVLGRSTGHSRGMGGSMHLWDESVGFYGSVPIVAGTVSLAVGAGLAAKMQLKGDISVAYLGDGAIEEGVVHESLNLARMLEVPIIFIVENNLFASHMHISSRQPSSSTARFAWANDIPYAVIDGNDVAEVHRVSEKFIESARSGGGCAFIEAVTYRWYGHVDWRDDIDVGVNRSEKDLSAWRKRDPIRRLVDGMILFGNFTENDFSNLLKEIQSEVDLEWAKALEDPAPGKEYLLRNVYAAG